MQTLPDIFKRAGGWNPSLYLKIENAPYMALVIEATGESGPSGLPAISVAHYGEQNGDLMRDPEMCFELGIAEGPHLDPFYFRNDYVGVEQWSRTIERGNYVHLSRLHEQHMHFAKEWDNNLRLQGFAGAFERQQTPRAYILSAMERPQAIVFAPPPRPFNPPKEAIMQNSSAFQFLALDTIHESAANPRRTFEESKLHELAESIRQHGLIQPITVRPNSEGFEIVAGARRFRAAQLAELFAIPARIVELTDAQALEWALVELSIVVNNFLCIHAARHVFDM